VNKPKVKIVKKNLTSVAAELIPESSVEFPDIISWQRCDVTFPLGSHQQVIFLESLLLN
jgi:hypothetical protein